MSKPPCIRGLKCFSKGCPQHSWNGNDGCPAFIEVDMKSKEGIVVEKVRECVDLYQVRLQFSTNCLLEGNVQTLESFRNGMIYKDESGNIIPKPNKAQIELLYHIRNTQKKLNNDIDNDILI